MKRALKLILSLAITVAFMVWAFRGTDIHQQWASMKAANYFWVLAYFPILIFIHLCRTLRWGYWLSGIEKVPFKKVNEASAIGFMMLLILPFRLGEFARPYLIAGRSGIRKSAAMTSVVLERIVDGMTIAVLLRVLLFFVPNQTPEVGYVKWGANVMFAIFGGGLVFLLFALWHQERAVRLVQATAGRLAPGVAHKVAEVVDSFVGAMRQLPKPGALFGFLVFTAGYWAANGFGMWVLSKAFDCDPALAGCLPFGLTHFQGYVVLSVLVVGLMVPAAPGMMGTFQFATKVGLALFLPAAVVNSKGLAYANVMWLCQTVQQIGFGFIFMLLGHMSFRDVAKNLGPPGDGGDDKPAGQAAVAAPTP